MPVNHPASIAAGPASGAYQGLRKVFRALAARQPSREILSLVAREAMAATGASNVAIGLRSDAAELLSFVAVAGDNASELTGVQIRVDDSLAESAIRTGQPSIFSEGARLPGGGAAAVVPIVRNGSIIGALLASTREADVRTPHVAIEETGLLGLFADQIALALATEDLSRLCDDQSRELAILYHATRTISGSLNVQDVLNSVLDAVCHHLEHQTVSLFLLNDERTHLFIAADRGLTEEDREIQLAADGSVTSSVIESRQPRLINDIELEPDLACVTSQGASRSALLAPIRSREATLGLIIVTSAHPDAFTDNDLKLLDAVASQAGVAIANAWMFEDAMRRAEEATALYDISQHVSATLHMDRVFQFVADNVLGLLKVDKFALMLLDPREDRLVTQISRGVDIERFAKIRPRVGDGIPGWVFEWMTPTAVADVMADARNRTAPIHQEGILSTIAVPMAVGDDVIGVLLAMSSRRRLFTVAEMELLYTIANQAAVAIANAKLYQDARSKSMEIRRYFHRVARALGSAFEVQDAPQLLSDLSVEMMRADRCAIYRVEDGSLRLHATSHFRPTAPADSRLPLGDGLTGWVARRGQALAVESLADDARSRTHSWLNRERLSSYMGVPLKIGRRTVGVLEIYTQESRAFTEDEVKLLTQFARRARLADRLVMDGA